MECELPRLKLQPTFVIYPSPPMMQMSSEDYAFCLQDLQDLQEEANLLSNSESLLAGL